MEFNGMGHIWPKFGSDQYGKSYGPYYVYYVNLIWATALHIKPIDVSLFRSVVYWYCLLSIGMTTYFVLKVHTVSIAFCLGTVLVHVPHSNNI